ncbi:MAG: helix-turn-helix domain-containing protein, partial [Saprospiraceae bacterium]
MLDYTPTFINRLDTIIEANLHKEDFSIEFLCKKLTISYTQTYRKIRAETGLTPSKYVCKKRLIQACFLLENSELTMSEIAFRVGFNTQN